MDTTKRPDTERMDWLNEDHQRLEEVFGAMVRNECGGDLRAIVDARMDTHGVNVGGSALKRPERFEFAMDFLGDPEAAELRAYIEALERTHGVLGTSTEQKGGA